MSRTFDVLLGGIRTYPTPDGALAVACGRDCGHRAGLPAGADLTAQIAAGRHDCPQRGEVMEEVLASLDSPDTVGLSHTACIEARRKTTTAAGSRRG
jgi:hypothetical protein